jgi:hypothetical protein
MHEFLGSRVMDKLAIFYLIKCLCNGGSVNDRKHSNQSSLLSNESLENIHKFGTVSINVSEKTCPAKWMEVYIKE